MPRSDFLIEPSELFALLSRLSQKEVQPSFPKPSQKEAQPPSQEPPPLRIVDLRGLILPPSHPKPWYLACREDYEKAHLPGAIFIDWLHDLQAKGDPSESSFLAPSDFAALMEEKGISTGGAVVVYDDDGGHTALRLWWLLRLYGHDDVRLLDGGWSRWLAEGYPTTPVIPAFPRGSFSPHLRPSLQVEVSEIHRVLQTPQSAVLIDCRGPAFYEGSVTRGQRSGHIPGAVNLPIQSLVFGPDKRWRSTEEIRSLYQNVGVSDHTKAITYCNAGVSASVGVFALSLAGFSNVANFSDSWYGWEADPSHPVVQIAKT